MSMMSISQNCGCTCHMWSHLSHVVTLVTLVTYGHTCHNCHMWSHLSHVVTLVTYGHICHKKSIFQLLTKKCIRCLKKTRPTYRPAWPQVKNLSSRILFYLISALYQGTCIQLITFTPRVCFVGHSLPLDH